MNDQNAKQEPLLPCPFCGAGGLHLEIINHDGSPSVYCHGCNSRGPDLIGGVSGTPGDAISRWNERSSRTPAITPADAPTGELKGQLEVAEAARDNAIADRDRMADEREKLKAILGVGGLHYQPNLPLALEARLHAEKGRHDRLADEIAELQAECERLKAACERWQPIETAPKDGKTRIIIAKFGDDEELVDIDFDAHMKEESESWEIPQTYWVWVSAYGRVEEPTHWMPLPAPPAATEGQG